MRAFMRARRYSRRTE